MTAPLFITTKMRHAGLPVLIIDKPCLLSKGLVSLLSEHFQTVLVSGKNPLPHLPHVTHVSYRRRIPAIPDDYFSAILLFYHGEQALVDGLASLLKKVKQNKAKLLLITSREYARLPVFKKALEEYEAASLIVYGDIFGLSSHEDSLPVRMIAEARHSGRVSVHGSGLSESYPVSYADTLQGILHVFLSHRPAKVNLLFPRQATPEIHLARLVTHLYPQAELQFVNTQLSAGKFATPPDGEIVIEDPYPLSEKLKLLKVSSQAEKIHAGRFKKRYFFRRKKLVLFGIFITTLAFLLPLLSFAFFLFGLLSLRVTLSAGEQGNLPLVAKRAETAKTLFKLSENTAGPVLLISGPLGLGEASDAYLANIVAGKTASEVAFSFADAGITYGKILSGQGIDPAGGMVRVTSGMKQAFLGLGQLRTEKRTPLSYQEALLRFEKPLRRLSGIIESLPYLTGVGRERKYLVLLQNNMELRPGGGFIGSYGLLTLKDGRIASFTINDVYDADGQLKGHIEPPFALSRYLGAAHLFLRDSNFDLEFAKNAALAASLLDLSVGERVDGVITLDVSFLRMLLDKLGPVYVPAIDRTVTAKDFYLQAQTAAEKDFFPGSTQKKDFLQYIARALVLSLEEADSLPLPALLQVLNNGVTQKHIMFSSADPAIMTLLLKNGFAPTVTKLPEEYEAEIADFLGVFDANLGVNKANFYIKRSITQAITLQRTGEREGTVTLTYENTSNQKSPFGGEYKNYLRVVLPEQAQITQIIIDKAVQRIIPAVTSSRVYSSDRFVPPVGLEVEQETLYGRSVFGFLLNVPQGNKKTVTLRYSVPAPSALPEEFEYVLRVFKQPGTDYDPYRLTFQYDPSLSVVHAPAFASRGRNTMQVTRVLSEDIMVPLQFIKQK